MVPGSFELNVAEEPRGRLDPVEARYLAAELFAEFIRALLPVGHEATNKLIHPAGRTLPAIGRGADKHVRRRAFRRRRPGIGKDFLKLFEEIARHRHLSLAALRAPVRATGELEHDHSILPMAEPLP